MKFPISRFPSIGFRQDIPVNSRAGHICYATHNDADDYSPPDPTKLNYDQS